MIDTVLTKNKLTNEWSRLLRLTMATWVTCQGMSLISQGPATDKTFWLATNLINIFDFS
jgi:hypothetical protein